MNEEFELIEFDQIRNEIDPISMFAMLQSKADSGYQVSILIKKSFDLMVTNKKNPIFSKWNDHDDDDVKNLFSIVPELHLPDQSFINQIGKHPPTLMLGSLPGSRAELINEKEDSSLHSSSSQLDNLNADKKITRRVKEGHPTHFTSFANTQLLTEYRSQQNVEIPYLDKQEVSNSQQEKRELLLDIFETYYSDFLMKLKENYFYSLLELGVQAYENRDFENALSKFADITLAAQKPKPESEDPITSLVCLQALLYQHQIFRKIAKFEESNKCLEIASTHFRINNIPLLAKIESEKAKNYLYLQKIQKALLCLQNALILYEKVNLESEIAYTLGQIGYILEQYDDAKKLCAEALIIFDSIRHKDDRQILEIEFFIAQINFSAKLYHTALHQLQQCAEKSIKIFGQNDLSLVKIYNLMGITQHLMGMILRAIESYQKAITILSDAEEESLPLAQVLNNLGLAQLDRMYARSATSSLSRSFSIYSKFFPENHPKMRKIILNLKLINRSARPII